MNKIFTFIKKESLQYKRNIPLLIHILVFMSLIQLFLYSYTISYDVKNIPMIIHNQDQSLISQNLCQKFLNTPLFNMKRFILDGNKIENILKTEEAQIILVIPRDFSTNIKHNKESSLQLIVDGTDSNTARISLNNASRIIKSFSKELITQIKLRRPINIVRSSSFKNSPQILYNPRQKGIIDMAPGIIATILFTQILTLSANSFAKEKEEGTIKQLQISRLGKEQYLIGKIAPIFIIGISMFLFMLISSKIMFKMPFRGNVFILLISIFIFLFSLINASFCFSTITKTVRNTFLLQTSSFVIPSIIFSGFLFPVENMPQLFQGISFFIPLRHFLEIFKGLTLKGSSIIHLRTQFIMLFAISSIFFTMGTFAFKRIFK